MLIAENHIKSTKQNNKDSKSRKGSIVNFETPKDFDNVTKSENSLDVREELRKKSLDKLLNDAKHELEQETQRKRKISFIRGYAANNSRALFRRRSSTTDYVRQGDHCQAKINLPPSLLIDKIKDTDNVCSWNKTLLKSQVLKRINDSVGISYQ